MCCSCHCLFLIILITANAGAKIKPGNSTRFPITVMLCPFNCI
jgi:hypothetical protein